MFRNAAFVVNLDSLDAFNDIKADENGVWKRKGAPVGYMSVHDGSKVVRRSKMKSFPHYYKITRTYYTHSSSPDFHRMIVVAHGMIIITCTCTVYLT